MMMRSVPPLLNLGEASRSSHVATSCHSPLGAPRNPLPGHPPAPPHPPLAPAPPPCASRSTRTGVRSSMASRRWDGESFLVQRIALRPAGAPAASMKWLPKLLPVRSAKGQAGAGAGEEGQGGSGEGGGKGAGARGAGAGEEEEVAERAQAASGLSHRSLLPIMACCRSPKDE